MCGHSHPDQRTPGWYGYPYRCTCHGESQMDTAEVPWLYGPISPRTEAVAVAGVDTWPEVCPTLLYAGEQALGNVDVWPNSQVPMSIVTCRTPKYLNQDSRIAVIQLSYFEIYIYLTITLEQESSHPVQGAYYIWYILHIYMIYTHRGTITHTIF